MASMRLLLVALALGVMFLAAGCGPPEPEGRDSSPASADASGKPGGSTATDAKPEATESGAQKDTNGNTQAQVDKVPERPMPGPDKPSPSTLGK